MLLRRKKKFRRHDYGKKRYGNPLFQKRRGGKSGYLNQSYAWQSKLTTAAIVLILGGLIYLIFYSPVFKIKSVEVSGAQEIPAGEIEALVWQQTNLSRFLLGRQNNLFLFDKNKLETELKNKYVLADLNLKKKYLFKSKLSISFTEKKFAIVWREGDKYYFAAADGGVIKEINPAEIKNKNYPVIEGVGESKIYDNQIIGQGEKINFILDLNEKIKNSQLNFTVEKFIIDETLLNAVKAAVASSGPQIVFSIKEEPAKQLNRLATLIKEKLKDDLYKKSYIDLSYGEKIYYK